MNQETRQLINAKCCLEVRIKCKDWSSKLLCRGAQILEDAGMEHHIDQKTVKKNKVISSKFMEPNVDRLGKRQL